MRWCFDTSALIEAWVRHYPPDLFPALWDQLGALAEGGIICAPPDVLEELERQKDDLFAWAKRLESMFVPHDRAVMERMKKIVNEHKGLIKVNSTKSGADPAVIALAEVRGIPVVTYETMAKESAAPRIPNVCSARGIRVATLVEVLRAEQIKGG